MAIRFTKLKDGETSLRTYFDTLAAKDSSKGIWRRAANALLRDGIASMEQLCELSETDLLHVRNFGKKCLELTLRVRDSFFQ